MTTPQGRTTRTTHDLAGRVTGISDEDAADQPVQELQPGGVSVQRTFDALGRLTKATGAGAEAATTADTFGYDAAGRLTSASAPGGTNTFTYDDRGNLLTSDGPSGTASFAYDEEGRPAARTDAAGQATFGYDTASRLTSIAYGGTGATRSLGYDLLDRPTSDTLKAPGGTTTASVAYAYDQKSQLTQKTTTGTAGAGTHSYDYDRAGRLTSWTAADDTVTTYGWDAAGNRTSAGGVTAVYGGWRRCARSAPGHGPARFAHISSSAHLLQPPRHGFSRRTRMRHSWSVTVGRHSPS